MLEKFLDQKMGAYSAAAAAALLAGGASAQAGLVKTDVNIVLTGPSSSHSIDLDNYGGIDVTINLNTSNFSTNNGPFTFTSGGYAYGGFMSNRGTMNSLWATALGIVGGGSADALGASVNVGANNVGSGSQLLGYKFASFGQSSFWYGTHTSASNVTRTFSTQFGPYSGSTLQGNFLGQSGKYLGVSFLIEGETHYGWVQIDVNDDATQATINGYAYQDIAGTGAHTPEPGSLALLALGAAGIAARRRRKGTA